MLRPRDVVGWLSRSLGRGVRAPRGASAPAASPARARREAAPVVARGPAPKIEHRFVHTNGVRLSCTVAGPEDGPLMVLLHGFPEFGGSWRRFVAPLARAGFRVVVPDQRGYGRSDKPMQVADYKLALLAADVAGLIRALGRSRAHVVGHDWGAAVAWWLAMTQPTMIERLVIMNVPHPAVMRKELFTNPDQFRRSWYMFFFQLPWLPERTFLKDAGRTIYEKMAQQSKPGAFPDEDLVHYQRAWTQPGAVRSMINWYRAAMRYQATAGDLEKRVTVPTLVVWGKRDMVLRAQMADASLTYCDDATLRYFDDAGHFVHHDEPVGVLEELLTFCAPAANTRAPAANDSAPAASDSAPAASDSAPAANN